MLTTLAAGKPVGRNRVGGSREESLHHGQFNRGEKGRSAGAQKMEAAAAPIMIFILVTSV